MVLTERIKMLTTTIQKLHHRGAIKNIQRILDKTHAADIAGVLQQLALDEAVEVYRLQDSASARASILSYLEPSFQKNLLERMDNQEAAEVVGEMESDDAADLLSELSDEESKNILENLVSEETSEVVGLMGYAEDTAGGIMTTDFLAFKEETTVQEVVQELQKDEDDPRILFYVYVVNLTGHLVGVLSLKHLLLSKKITPLRDLMTTNVIAVKTDTDQEHVADTVERYDFLSIPVVDEGNKLVGVITVDDVIDVIKEEAEEDLLAMAQAGWGLNMSWSEHLSARVPWLLLSLLVGFICFAIIYTFGPQGESISLAAIIPLLLSLGATAGNQTASVVNSALRAGRFFGADLSKHIYREFLLTLFLAGSMSIVVYAVGGWLIPELVWHQIFALSVGFQIFVSMFLGMWLPVLLDKLSLDPGLLTPPIYAALADIAAILILFGLYNAY